MLVREAGKKLLHGRLGSSIRTFAEAMQIDAGGAIGSIPFEIRRWMKK
jgi:hypothetical protein